MPVEPMTAPPMTAPPMKAISFGSSGVLMVGQMGIYCRLYEAGHTTDIKNFYGCSGGGICAYLCALGVTPAWIREWVQHFDTRPLINIQEDLVADYLTSWGVDSGMQAKEYLSKFIDTWEPGASSWTFADLAAHRPGIQLTIIATNVTKERQEVFSVETHPSMLISDAIIASSAVPFFICPWIDPSGQIFCDGAVIESYPYRCVRDPATTIFVSCERMAPSYAVSSLGDYINRIMRITRFGNRRVKGAETVIHLKYRGIMLLNFMITKEERLAVFTSGLADAEEWITRTFPGGTGGNPPLSGGLHTLSAGRPSPGRLSDSHRSDSLLPPPSPSPGSPPSGRRRYRRWSY